MHMNFFFSFFFLNVTTHQGLKMQFSNQNSCREHLTSIFIQTKDVYYCEISYLRFPVK